MTTRLIGAVITVLAMALPAQRPTAAQMLARMTDKEKVGQLFMSWILSRADDAAREQMKRWIREVGLGGVVLSLGSAEQARALIRELQAESKVPLIVAGDFERGLAFRLTGTTDLGSAMLLGATRSPGLAYAAGQATAREGRALGFHWTFSPVADVNVNPANPIINVRSFGEDPEAVATMAAAYVKGVQSGGMLATAKHFPGHGDVASDSHLVMPTVSGDRDRLDRVELKPFRRCIAEANVAAVMTGHLSVPGLGEDPAVPATLSSRILGGVLRTELGFDGIIVTDALDMGGVREEIAPAEACVRALRAGADLLLMPPDPIAARDAILAALRDGRVARARLDDAVRRLLTAKVEFGRRPVAARRSRDPQETPRRLARRIAERGITIARDAQGLLPLRDAGLVAVISLLDAGDERGRAFAGQMLRDAGRRRISSHVLAPDSDDAAMAAARETIAAADVVVVGLFAKVRSSSGKLGLPAKLTPVVDALVSHKRVIAVSFGDPYVARALPRVRTYVCAYGGGAIVEAATARVLVGTGPATGRLPVSIPGIARRGAGSSLYPGRVLRPLSRANPPAPATLPKQVTKLLERAVDERVFPGAVALVTRRDEVVLEITAGRRTYDADAPAIVLDDTFDLASLTKVCATGPTVLRLVAAGKMAVDDPVSKYVPAFTGGDKDQVTLLHLLTHSSGLPPYIKFFLEIEGKANIVDAAAGTPLDNPPGTRTRYSDLGLILLMACVEAATGEAFEVVVEREVFEPLGMTRARFSRTGRPLDAIPTEDCPWRKRVVRGEVHDENAYAMGGVSGHAGLFATARDVAKLGVAYLGGGRGWLRADLVRRATRRAAVVDGSSRGIAWDTFTAGGSSGDLLSKRSFGHTGFTGTSIWCDPDRELCIVLLTNRVHPSRARSRIQRVRGALADLVVRSLRD